MMKKRKPININAKKVKRYIKENNKYFIKNDERVQRELDNSQFQVKNGLMHLCDAGFLEKYSQVGSKIVYRITKINP